MTLVLLLLVTLDLITTLMRARGIIFIYYKNSHYYDPTNKKVIGKFKDEAAGVPITEFVGLKSK